MCCSPRSRRCRRIDRHLIMAMALDDAAQHCDELLRSEDKDRWLTALFVPEERRPLIHALYALNVELARIRGLVREPMLGEIRLQWGGRGHRHLYRRDGRPPRPAVAGARHRGGRSAAPCLSQHDRGEKFDLYDDPMPSMTDLEGYLGETSSALIQLAALVLAGEEALRTPTVSGYAGGGRNCRPHAILAATSRPRPVLHPARLAGPAHAHVPGRADAHGGAACRAASPG